MKNIKIQKLLLSAGLLLTLLSFASCDDFFDKTPLDQISTNGYWTGEDAVRNWASGTYNQVQTALMQNIQKWGDGRTDNLFPTIYDSGEQLQFNRINNTYARTNWTDLYAVINQCNIGIEQIGAMSNISETSKNLFLGQFYGLRALMYYYIVRLWGPAPLVLISWDGNLASKYNVRTPVAEIAAQIESDINRAIELCLVPGGGSGNNAPFGTIWFFNRGAAYSLKMDFLAWQGRYSEIPAVFNSLDALNAYSLVTSVYDWNLIFSNPAASKETIFSLYWDTTQNGNIRSPYANTIGHSGSNGAFCLSWEMYENMIRDTMDIRLWGVIQRNQLGTELTMDYAPIYKGTSTIPRNNLQATQKYWPLGAERGTFVTSQTDIAFKPPVFRYADMMLLYAEALNRNGDGQGAIDVVNKIRASRGATLLFSLSDYPTQLGNTADSREKLIMDERQLELFQEGKRWFDLLRMSWGVEVLDAHMKYLQAIENDDQVGFDDVNRLLWPLHTSVMAANPDNLYQNAGY